MPYVGGGAPQRLFASAERTIIEALPMPNGPHVIRRPGGIPGDLDYASRDLS